VKRRAVTARARIERALADDRVVSIDAPGSLPARTSRLQIEYTSLRLAAPHKTRFRYRLEGFDAEWIDARTQRHAAYARLPAGDYRFRVATGTSDGSWEGQEASWDFTVRPLFYQTGWFLGACSTGIVLLTWMAWQLRVRRIRRQFGLLLGERVRLSREIHDTLLQSLVGVTLQFDALSKSVDSPEAKQQVVRIRKQVQEYIREARHTIWNLRSPMVETGDLATAVREAADRATFGTPVQLDFIVSGMPFRCHHMAEEQLIRIVQEAVINAVRHGRAHRVRVELEYGEESVTVRVSDDGCGFDPARAGLETTGHYGLTSMRERTEQVDGRFTVLSTINAGTTIQAVLQKSVVLPE
jgi:signal transduction histidine kinase